MRIILIRLLTWGLILMYGLLHTKLVHSGVTIFFVFSNHPRSRCPMDTTSTKTYLKKKLMKPIQKNKKNKKNILIYKTANQLLFDKDPAVRKRERQLLAMDCFKQAFTRKFGSFCVDGQVTVDECTSYKLFFKTPCTEGLNDLVEANLLRWGDTDQTKLGYLITSEDELFPIFESDSSEIDVASVSSDDVQYIGTSYNGVFKQ